jgi:oxygen-independent coproporphyrinogen-3 oxidase
MAGIYLHIPFCKQACFYCDFHFSTSLKRKGEMIEAITKELRMRKEEIKEPVESIYFGGGTPSLLETKEITFLLEVIYANFVVTSSAEITLEANPDDLTSQKIKALACTKINRLSIGVQSFFEDDLKFMNRAHTAVESEFCIREAKKYFDNITIDLIYGVPNMSNEKWRKNLKKAFDLEVPHISSYALTVEEKTALANFIEKGKMPPLDERLAENHFRILVDETSKNGFIAYEISNFGKPNFFSKHNTSYWQGKSYLGIGPSAHSYNKTSRSWNVANNTQYIKSITAKSLPLESEQLSENDRFNEAVMTGLRTIWGVSLSKIETEFGIDKKLELLENAQKHILKKLLILEGDTLYITEKGKFLADGIASDLFLLT